MLAQNFKTPADLKITDAEFDALAKVLGMLERGDIKDYEFGMAAWYKTTACGTVHCIGGWARTILGAHAFNYTAPWTKDPLSRLFYPKAHYVAGRLVNAYDATRDQAAIALRNYLTHGEPRWEEALA